MRGPFTAWVDRVRANQNDRRRAEVVEHLTRLHALAQHLEAQYRDDGVAARTLAPRVVAAMEELAANAGRSVQALGRRVAHLGGGVDSGPVRVARGGENMWGLLGRALERERDFLAMGREDRGLAEWDPGTAELLKQVRKEAEGRERQVKDLVARL